MQELDEMYFDWLVNKVSVNQNTPTTRHKNLFRMLHTTEFIWQLSGDDNRAEDGMDLRREFLIEADAPDHPEWRTGDGCSVLEMLIAFSRRCESETDDLAFDWFWEILENLGLKDCNDGDWPGDELVADTLHIFVWRLYRPDGRGGAFPIEHPSHDQREVELWYQLFDYLADQDRLL